MRHTGWHMNKLPEELIDAFHMAGMEFNSTRTPEELLQRVVLAVTEIDKSRGIFKRIDENRELLECLQEHAPEVLERLCWLEDFIAINDKFFVDIANALELKPLGMGSRFPRPWSGNSSMGDCYINFENVGGDHA